MAETSTTLPLAHDFADRLEAVRREAMKGGHCDLDHLLEMAVTIAKRRIEGQATTSALVDSELLRRRTGTSEAA